MIARWPIGVGLLGGKCAKHCLLQVLLLQQPAILAHRAEGLPAALLRLHDPGTSGSKCACVFLGLRPRHGVELAKFVGDEAGNQIHPRPRLDGPCLQGVVRNNKSLAIFPGQHEA